jgi:DNA-binding HxlR family transcriptional regulator
MDLKKEILNWLDGRDWTPTLKIARGIFGSTATKKMVNPTLYSLEKEGLAEVRKSENDSRPEWRLCNATANLQTAIRVYPFCQEIDS